MQYSSLTPLEWPKRYFWGGIMSFTLKGEELPKRGKELPSIAARHEHALAIAAALREELAAGASLKTIMAWTGASERTVKGWLAGSCGPSGLHFEGLVRSSEAIYRRLMIRTGRSPVVSRKSLEVLRQEIRGGAGAIEAALTE